MLYKDTITKLSEFYPLKVVEDDSLVSSAWFIPDGSNFPLTLTWGDDSEHGITLSFALGQLPSYTDQKVLLELMTVNMMMAAVHGPRFSYSRSAEMITLMSSIPLDFINEQNIYDIRDVIENLISRGRRARLHMESEGVKLSSDLG